MSGVSFKRSFASVDWSSLCRQIFRLLNHTHKHTMILFKLFYQNSFKVFLKFIYRKHITFIRLAPVRSTVSSLLLSSWNISFLIFGNLLWLSQLVRYFFTYFGTLTSFGLWSDRPLSLIVLISSILQCLSFLLTKVSSNSNHLADFKLNHVPLFAHFLIISVHICQPCFSHQSFEPFQPHSFFPHYSFHTHII